MTATPGPPHWRFRKSEYLPDWYVLESTRYRKYGVPEGTEAEWRLLIEALHAGEPACPGTRLGWAPAFGIYSPRNYVKREDWIEVFGFGDITPATVANWLETRLLEIQTAAMPADVWPVLIETMQTTLQNSQDYGSDIRIPPRETKKRCECVVWPYRRPSQRSIVCCFEMYPAHVNFNGTVCKHKTPQGWAQLSNALAEWAFCFRTEMMPRLRAENAKPIAGWLKNAKPIAGWLKLETNDWATSTPWSWSAPTSLADVALEIAPKEQDKILVAPVGGDVSVVVTLTAPYGNFVPYNEQTAYMLLAAEGVFVAVEVHAQCPDGGIAICGKRLQARE